MDFDFADTITLGLADNGTIRAQTLEGDLWAYGRTVEEAVDQLRRAGEEATRLANDGLPERSGRGHATRVDIVTVRDPDYSNAYTVFVNGEDVTEGDHGAYVMGLPMENELRLEIWDIDLGRDDLSDPAVWAEWQYARADHDSDLTIPQAVRASIANLALQVAEKHGHAYPVK